MGSSNIWFIGYRSRGFYMTQENRTHYRKVFKSDHLGVADLEEYLEAGNNLIFTISHVKQEYGAKVAGKKIDANIAYFIEPIKPLVLNATNSKTMKNLVGGSPIIEDWSNVPVRLYIEAGAKLKGEVVGGVRIHPDKVAMQKPAIKEGTDQWNNAIAAFQRDGNLGAVLKRVTLTDIQQEAIKKEASTPEKESVS